MRNGICDGNQLPSCCGAAAENKNIRSPCFFVRGFNIQLFDRVLSHEREDPVAGIPPVNIQAFTFSDIEPEPWVETADEAGRIAKNEGCVCVIGVGGGSAMDVAKAASVLATNPGKASEYQGLELVKSPGLPKIMIPTTAGTGSEVTFTAVLSRKEPKMKAGINGKYLFPDIAILDPMLTLSLPPETTATTGMDAMTHAVVRSRFWAMNAPSQNARI